MKEKIEISLSKSKIILIAIGSLIFIGLSIFLTLNTDLFQDHPFSFLRNPIVIISVGVLGILFFGMTGLYAFRKILDKKAGLIIDAAGIIDNSNGSSIGLIEWKDITDIEIKRAASTKFIIINVINSEKYIERANSRFKTRLMQSNMKLTGSPIAITAASLKYNFKNLEELLQSEFNRNKKIR